MKEQVKPLRGLLLNKVMSRNNKINDAVQYRNDKSGARASDAATITAMAI